MNSFLIAAFALLLDRISGEPDMLWKRLPHPVVLMGNLIGAGDRLLNTGEMRKIKGVLLIGFLSFLAIGTGLLIRAVPDYGALEILFGAFLLAHKSLVTHVADVADALEASLSEGRRSVARIVGRNTADMDETAVSRAAIESAAENYSDGVVAPLFYLVLFGLPGILLYKMVNTADSMIGYKNDKYQEFGWAAARLDDLLNWAPARITFAELMARGKSHELRRNPARWAEIKQDAENHRSPNAGWPELGMAIRLNLALSGPRSYDNRLVDFPFVFAQGRKSAAPADIRAAVAVLNESWLTFFGVLLFAGFLWAIIF